MGDVLHGASFYGNTGLCAAKSKCQEETAMIYKASGQEIWNLKS